MGTSSSRRDLDNHESVRRPFTRRFGLCRPEAEPKPEADAAADAWYSYYGYGHPGYYGAYRRYYGLGWGGYYGGYYGYPGYGYRYWKRDAEAEAEPKAEAEADPAVLYSSVYGHGLTYGYPYYGYG